MKIDTRGHHRIVILIGNYAIKIARIKPLWFMMRLCGWSIRPIRERFYQSTWKEALRDYFGNMVCNWLEYHYHRLSKDERVVPTRHLILFGLIAVQERGNPVTKKELRRECPFFADLEFYTHLADMDKEYQYVRLKDGTIRLADYGSFGRTIRPLLASRKRGSNMTSCARQLIRDTPRQLAWAS